jgi:hypothetical protein
VERLQNDAKKICGCCAAVASEVKSVERKVFLDLGDEGRFFRSVVELVGCASSVRCVLFFVSVFVSELFEACVSDQVRDGHSGIAFLGFAYTLTSTEAGESTPRLPGASFLWYDVTRYGRQASECASFVPDKAVGARRATRLAQLQFRASAQVVSVNRCYPCSGHMCPLSGWTWGLSGKVASNSF